MHFELQFKATLQPDDYRFIVANHNGTEIAQTTYFEITEPSAIQGMAAQTADAPVYCSAPGETDIRFRYGGKVHVPTFTTAEDNGFSLPTSLKARTETTVLPPDSCTMESTCCVS